MDRRRKLFIVFLCMLAVSVWDVRVTRGNILDQWARKFEFKGDIMKPGDPKVFAPATATTRLTHAAVGLGKVTAGSVEIVETLERP